MYDIHTHVLPGIDDGSRSVEESVQMLRLLQQYGVHTVVATPHYDQEHAADSFLERRADAYGRLLPHCDGLPRLVLGAEVLLHPGLSAQRRLRELCIGETDYILIEMPYTRWQDWVFDELFVLIAKCGLHPVIAHLDRYVHLEAEGQIRKLLHMEVYAQLNADALAHPFRRKTGKHLLESGKVQFLGSDCHNLSTRTPLCLQQTVQFIRKRWGQDVLEQFWRHARCMLENQLI